MHLQKFHPNVQRRHLTWMQSTYREVLSDMHIYCLLTLKWSQECVLLSLTGIGHRCENTIHWNKAGIGSILMPSIHTHQSLPQIYLTTRDVTQMVEAKQKKDDF